jgi:hypothetical protein
MKQMTAVPVAALLFGAAVIGQSGQVTMNEEPHHQRLTYIRHMRVFEVNMPPGGSTLDHTHDHDVATIALSDGTTRSRRTGEDWAAPQMWAQGGGEITTYTGAPATHRTENVGTTPYRMLVVENLRDRGWTMPASLTAPGTTLRLDARSFAVYDMRLNAATPRTNHVHQNPSFIFLRSGVVQVQGGGGESEFRLEQAGTWWFPSSGPDQPHTIALVGTGDAHVICVEAR